MQCYELVDRPSGETVSLSYDVAGTGTPVVRLHGLTSSRARERLLGPDPLAGLVAHRVIRYDARGHGRSTGPRHPDAYAWPRLAEDLLALLDHVVPNEPVHGVGTSMGAGTLLHAAVRRPGRFSSLSLLTPPTAWATRAAQSVAYVESAEQIERSGVACWCAVTRELPPAVRPDRPVTMPDVAESLLPAVLRGAARTDLPTPEQLATLDLPTLLLAWIDDPSHPLSTAETLHRVLPSSRLVVARTPADVETWSGRIADHVNGVGQSSAREEALGRR